MIFTRAGDKSRVQMWTKGEGDKGIPKNAVITVNGSASCSVNYDWLRFQYLDSFQGIYLPIAFQISNSYWKVFGEKNNGGLYEPVSVSYSWQTEMVIQISSMLPYGYDIYFNDNYLRYDYNSHWFYFNGIRLDSLNNIKSDLFCTSYSYIMVCETPTPIICTIAPLQQPILGEDYTLNCNATGSPVLVLEWSVEYEDRKTTMRDSVKIELVQSEPAVITSVLTISEFTVYDIGVYSCSVTNKRFVNFLTKI